MFYKLIAAAISVPIAALSATLLSELGSPIMSDISAALGSDHMLVVGLTGVITWFAVAAFLSILIDVFTGAIVESGMR
ncbi:hypothetical protein ELS19_06135 [Halogeometricum borinquense]|uniref:Uncharacterized protein n=1 Tax=Halogeometricum borinquense TaxID=60847 RepID=A0A482TL07_9EURY|nr:hypothetical protein [Halogeometricum borinquense]RYJ13575.1 hypothetical protein ELS19_06135 [Halogeometricum borinquense]